MLTILGKLSKLATNIWFLRFIQYLAQLAFLMLVLQQLKLKQLNLYLYA